MMTLYLYIMVYDDTVLVYAGTYTENILIDNQYVIVKTVSGPDSTIINGGNNGSCLIISGASNVTWSGFSLRSGLASNGGGINVSVSETVLLENLYVFSNLASNDGGGIYIEADNTGSVTINATKIQIVLFIYEPSRDLLEESYDIWQEYYDLAYFSGEVYSKDEVMEILLENEMWSPHDDQQADQMEDQIEELKVQAFQSYFNVKKLVGIKLVSELNVGIQIF